MFKYILLFFHISISQVFGQITSITGGSWHETSTWDTGTIPTSSDNVIIDLGHDVFINVADAECQNLTIKGGLSLNNNSLTVTGTTTIASGGIFTHDSDGSLARFTGVITNDGTFRTGTSGTFQFTFRGDITNNGTFDFQSSPQCKFEVGTITITNNTSNLMRFSDALANGLCTIDTDVIVTNGSFTGDIQLFGNVGVVINGSLTNNCTTGSLITTYLTGAGSFQNNGSLTMKSGTLSDVSTFANSSASVFTYDYSGTGNVKGGVTYGSLQISGSGTKTLSGGINISGNLTNNIGANFETGTTTIQFNGTGTQTITGITTFGNLTINNTAAVNDYVDVMTGDVRVTTSLTLSNGRLRLNDNDFLYDPNVEVTTTNGWVETNGTGKFVNNGGVATIYPVGDDLNPQFISLSNPALGSTPSITVPNSGAGAWFVDNMGTASNITLLDPQGTVDASSLVHKYNIPTPSDWNALSTNFSTPNYEVTGALIGSFAEFSIYTPLSEPFITTWQTDNPGTSNLKQILIPLEPSTNYNFTVDWGDDSPSETFSGLGSSLNRK